VVYDREGDAHYDTISAFIKSLRGSDPDAAVYYLAVMLKGGEDPKFIARRLIVAASEDVGNADPRALEVAVAAARAVEFVGLPEARINLGHATVYLATAPKSNRSYAALGKAMADVQEQPRGEVPLHLRDAHYKGAASLGHGKGYDYPHDDPRGWVEQDYRPPGLQGRRYYEPSAHGAERHVAERLAQQPRPEEEHDERE
jgi:putative ATPase